jgi:DNA-binding response OmpR family regulator
LAAGASDYFSKPIDMERLLARIAQLIGPAAPATPEQRR